MELEPASGDLVRVAVATLGADVLHARYGQADDDDRRYFTGIEIGLLVATNIAIAYWKGFFRVMRKRVPGGAEQLGEQSANALLDNLSRAFRKHREKDLPAQAREVQGRLDEVVRDNLSGLTDEEFRTDLAAAEEQQVAEIADYLTGAGFAPDEADEHARRLIERFRQELD